MGGAGVLGGVGEASHAEWQERESQACPPPGCWQDSGYVVALRSHITDDRSLLSFHRGDLIKLVPVASLEPGTLWGTPSRASGGHGLADPPL